MIARKEKFATLHIHLQQGNFLERFAYHAVWNYAVCVPGYYIPKMCLLTYGGYKIATQEKNVYG